MIDFRQKPMRVTFNLWMIPWGTPMDNLQFANTIHMISQIVQYVGSNRRLKQLMGLATMGPKITSRFNSCISVFFKWPS